ncbi:2Fe-2S iron-sulfur cluster-binding protein [Bifidobacterium thermacidophilum]|uniref:succinate dehydrogenase n=1 Tax=Bifidobacterium thermacidophilum TaxID=246618 RepID=A0ABW8KPT3_9BIFI
MNGNDGTRVQVTLRVHRFTPRPERDRPRSGSPFAKQGSPFGSGTARRRPRGKQWTQDYLLSVLPDTTILDCLLDIKRTQDPSLAFRYSCGHGMCGSDAVAINGTPTLLCTAKVKDWAVAQTAQNTTDAEGFRKTAGTDADPADNATDVSSTSGVSGAYDGSPLVIELSALPGFPVQRDLIADIDPMLEQIKRLKPYLHADGKLATTRDGKIDVFEYLQRPEQLAAYETLSNCIACGVCEGSCPVFAGGEAFIGPAALITASRFINDSRDTAADARMDAIDTADGIAACQSVRACSRHCPRGIDVGEEIWQLIAKVKER